MAVGEVVDEVCVYDLAIVINVLLDSVQGNVYIVGICCRGCCLRTSLFLRPALALPLLILRKLTCMLSFSL